MSLGDLAEAVPAVILAACIAAIVSMLLARRASQEAARARRAEAYAKFLGAFSTHCSAMMDIAVRAGTRHPRQDIGRQLADEQHPELVETSRAVTVAFYEVSFWAPDSICSEVKRATRLVDPQDPFFLAVGPKLQRAVSASHLRQAASDAAMETLYGGLEACVGAMQRDVGRKPGVKAYFAAWRQLRRTTPALKPAAAVGPGDGDDTEARRGIL